MLRLSRQSGKSSNIMVDNMLNDRLPQNIFFRLPILFILVFATTAGIAWLLGNRSSPVFAAGATAVLVSIREYRQYKKQRHGNGKV